MSEPLRSLDRISVPEPCNVNWEAMRGNDQIRFCRHCRLHVTDLSRLTRREAMLLVARSKGRLCVRFVPSPDGGALTSEVPETLHQIVRRVSRLAAGAFSAAITFSSAAAQSDSKHLSGPPTTNIDRVVAGVAQGAKLSGVVTDPNGAVVPGVTITMTNKQSHVVFVYATKEDGQYQFSLLEAGSYEIEAKAPGFAKPAPLEVELETNAAAIRDFTLALPDISAVVEIRTEATEQFVTMGVVAVSEPKDPFIKAAFQDDLELVLALLPTTADVDTHDVFTNTNALGYAIENHNREMVRALLSGGAGINASNRSGRTPLMHLGKEATVELVRDLLAAGAAVNARDESGETVLMSTAGVCTLEVFKELIASGARMDAKDYQRNTVLMRAAQNDDAGIVRFLIAAGASVDERNEDGESALQAAARYGRGEVLRALIEAGAAINLSTSELNGALILATRNEDPMAVKALLKAGADPNSRDAQDTTALMFAAEYGQPETLKALIAAGSELNATDSNGWTAMMHANEVENVRVLLDAGADTTIKNEDGETALAMAIKYDQSEVVKLLKSRGAPE